MASNVSIGGLVSGLDTNNIIEQLVAIQSNRVTQLQAKQKEQTDKATLFQTLQGNYLGVLTAASSLADSSLYGQKTASSSNTDILSVTASSTAATGSHQLVVKQLAKKNQYVSNRFSDTGVTTLGSGTLTITLGSGSSAVSTDVTIGSTNNTLTGIANAINQSGAAVTAAIIKVDSSSTPYQLTVTAKEAGEGNAVTLSQTSDIKSTVTGEILGAGAATATQDIDDANGATYALRHLPNAGTTTIKLDGATITATLGPPSTGLSAVDVDDAAGTLTVGREYSYVVSAVDASGETLQSAITSRTVGAGNEAIDFSFDRVVGATSYRVYRLDDTEYAATGGAGLEAADFQQQDSLIGTVTDTGAGSYTFRDTGQAQQAGQRALAASTQGYTLTETTGAVVFRQSQTEAVTANYEYDLEFKQSEAAQDAILEFGAGANAITVRKSTNTITDVIEGVTLSLKKADAAATVIVDVSRNTLGVSSAVSALVSALNATESFIQENTFFDSDTNETGALFSDFNLFLVRSRVSEILTGVVSSVPPGKLRSLSDAGVSLNPSTGNFSIATSELSALLSTKPDEVRGLFASVAEATDIDVKALTFTSDTKTSTSVGYAVRITQAATRATDTGAQDVSAGITQDETLTITTGGFSVSVNLTNGMTAQAAASAINTALQGGGISTLTASFNSATGKISIQHNSYGAEHSFSVKSTLASGTAGGSGLGNATASVESVFTGQDVAGTINSEAATGKGQTLTGNAGNANTDGLQIQVTITPDQLAAQGEDQGNVVVTGGLASELKKYLSFLTDASESGPIQGAIEEANKRVEDLQNQIASVEARVARERTRLNEQFARLEQALGALQTTSQFLSGQLAQLAANSASIAKGR